MRPILAAIRALPGVTDIDNDSRHGMILARVPGFMIRVLRRDDVRINDTLIERRYTIQFAHRPSFDRWANSTHFETEAHWTPQRRRYVVGPRKGEPIPQWTMPDLRRELAWCRKVVRSGCFDFASYIGTVRTPWFIHPVKRR